MLNRFFFRLLLIGQFFLFVVLLVVSLYLLVMALSPKTAAEIVPGAERNSAICLLISPLWLVPALFVRLKTPWAWWMGFSVNLFACVFLAWALGFGPGSTDFATMAFPGVFFVLTILHLLSRPTTWKAMELQKYPSFAKKPV